MYMTSVLWKPFISTDRCNILSTQKAAAKDPCIRYKSFTAAFLCTDSLFLLFLRQNWQIHIVHNPVRYVDKPILAYTVYNPLQHRFIPHFYLSIQLIQSALVPSFPYRSIHPPLQEKNSQFFNGYSEFIHRVIHKQWITLQYYSYSPKPLSLNFLLNHVINGCSGFFNSTPTARPITPKISKCQKSNTKFSTIGPDIASRIAPMA